MKARKPPASDTRRSMDLNAKLASASGLTADENRELMHLNIRAAAFEKQQTQEGADV